MPLKLYYHLASQPSRACYIFLKINNIPFEACVVDLTTAEHKTEKFAAINPFQRVPVLDDDGFILTESNAILKYLALKFKLDRWYPSGDLQQQARIDECLHWFHLNLRHFGFTYFQTRVWRPLVTGCEIDTKKLEYAREQLLESANQFESYFIAKTPFSFSDQVGIADIQVLAEFMQPFAAGFDVFAERPKLAAWRDRVKAAIGPVYDEANVFVYKIAEDVVKSSAKL